MANAHFDRFCSDEDRRTALYNGDIFVFSPLDPALRLCALAQEMTNRAFAPHDPLRLHCCMSVEGCAQILGTLKPEFIHHPLCKQLLPELVRSVGGDPNEIYFDVPRLRSAYPMTYLTSGIAYAFHPHRDTWYSAPMSQINWWLPVSEISAGNCLAFTQNTFVKRVGTIPRSTITLTGIREVALTRQSTSGRTPASNRSLRSQYMANR